MDSDMNDMVSPSQSSPSMTGNVGQAKGSSSSENSTIVSFAWEKFVYMLFYADFLLPAPHKTATARAC